MDVFLVAFPIDDLRLQGVFTYVIELATRCLDVKILACLQYKISNHSRDSSQPFKPRNSC